MKAIIILLLSVSAVAQVSSGGTVPPTTANLGREHAGRLTAAKSVEYFRPLEFAMVASAAFDSYTTVRTLSNGCIERNPLMGKHPSTAHIAVFEAGWTAGELVAAHFLRRHHPKIAAALLGESIIEHGVAGGLNTTNRCF